MLEVDQVSELTNINANLKVTGAGTLHVTATGQSLGGISIADNITVKEGALGSETESTTKLGGTVLDSSKPIYSAPSGARPQARFISQRIAPLRLPGAALAMMLR